MKNIYLFSLISFTFWFSSCIEPVKIETSNFENIAFVDADISDRNEEHVIKLSTIGAFNVQKPNWLQFAKVKLISDKGDEVVFMEQEEGQYRFTGQLDITKKYKLDIILNTNTRVRSDFQSFPQPISFDSIKHKTEYEYLQGSDGNLRQNFNVRFSSIAKNVKVDKPYFLRFDVETVMFVEEIMCSPFVSAKSCFVYNHRSPYDINLVNIEPTAEARNISIEVFDKEIDYEMGGAFSVKADVLSYNKESYDLWVQLKNVFDQSGSITDLVPSRFRGNVYSEDVDVPVSGLFSLQAKTSVSRVFLRNDVGGRYVEPFCGTPGFWQPYPWPSRCCDCLLFENSTIEKPSYW